MYTYIANRPLTWAGPGPGAWTRAQGCPGPGPRPGPGLDPGPGLAALGSGPGSRAGPGPCKWPVSYIYVCIFYTNLRYFIPKDN